MNGIHGFTAPGYEPVAAAFAAAFNGRPTMGAALAVRQDGREVVNLWGGVADERDGARWSEDTAAVIFSCTKGLVAILAGQLVDAGRLDYDAPVSRYWPEFEAMGKGRITVAQLLGHRAGLSVPDADFSFEDILDWDRVTGVLAAQAPRWDPDRTHAYHALTFGWLAGELVRRVSGKSVGALFRSNIAEPLKANARIGIPANHTLPIAHMQVAPGLETLWANEAARDSAETPNWGYRAMTLGSALPAALVTPDGGFNDRRLQEAEIAGAGGIANARALAAIWSATVVQTDGVRLLSAETAERAARMVSGGPPAFPVDPPYARWGSGFQIDSEARQYLTTESFGHDGAGGQVTFADPVHRVGFAFITNWMEDLEADGRATGIIASLRSVVAAPLTARAS